MERILSSTTLASTKKFFIEGIDIDFDNGHRAQFERVRFQGEGRGVMIVALQKEWSDTFVYLIEHFLVGVEKREFVLPGWYREPELSFFDACNKELKEEIWFGARSIKALIDMELLPGYMKGHTQLALATDLYPEQVQWDEFETMIIHKMLYQDALDLIHQGKITDARTIAWLLYAQTMVAH